MTIQQDVAKIEEWFRYCEAKFNGQATDIFIKEMTYAELKSLLAERKRHVEALERVKGTYECNGWMKSCVHCIAKQALAEGNL